MHRFYIHYIFLAFTSMFLLTACNDIQTDQLTATDSAEQTTTVEDTPLSIDSTDTNKEVKGDTFTATIIKVVDGDTVKIKLNNGDEETVRLLLIDTPETVHPTKDVQPFGPEASQFAKKLMPAGSQVEVELGIGERDKYRRLLAYFYVDGQMVNKQLLEKGLARVAYVYAPNTKYLDELEAIQQKAQQKSIGIWSIENYVTEKGFNDSTTIESKQEKTITERTDCPNPTIKGNINSKGEKIYHLSSGQYYGITKAEEMFCTETEAQAAGFRKSER